MLADRTLSFHTTWPASNSKLAINPAMATGPSRDISAFGQAD